MMKRFFMILVVLILMLVPNVVFGEESKHIYSIEKFQINNNATIDVAGYSFISHVDNYGIDNNGFGNLKTSIIAYADGSWNDNFINKKSCNDSEGCYWINTKVEGRDMFGARCIGSICNYETELLNYTKENNKFRGSMCHKDDENESLYDDIINSMKGVKPFDSGVSGCLYYNVGFSARIDLNDIIAELFGNSNSDNSIKLKLVSEVTGLGNENKKLASDFGVSRQVCIFGKNELGCSNNEIITIGDYDIKLGKLSDSGNLNANDVVAIQSFDGKEISRANVNFSNEDKDYYVLEKIGPREFSKTTHDNVTFIDSLVKVRAIAQDGAVIPSDDNNKFYYAYANYFVFSGDLTISTKKRYETKDCGSLFGTAKDTEASVSCGSSDSLKECKNYKNVSGTIYVKSNDVSCSVFKKKIGNSYYVPITVTTNVVINQEGKFTFGKFSSEKVKAGKGFSLGSTVYENTISWKIANYYWNTNNPYYSYSAENYILNSDKCIVDVDFDPTSYSKYYDSNGKEIGNLTDASFKVISDEVNKLISSNIDMKFKSCDSNDASDCNLTNPTSDVLGTWEAKMVSSEKNGSIGYTYKNKYTYSLANAYVVLKDTNYNGTSYKNSDVYYDIKKLDLDAFYNTGRKYYVDFKYLYEYMPFYLKEGNPSVVSEMKWKLNGTCSIEVEPGYFVPKKDPGDPDVVNTLFKYRSISLSNPFPKFNNNYENIVVNWRDWYKIPNNKNRISKTHDNGVVYGVTISKYDGNGVLSISDINAITSHYGSLEGISMDGVSDFITKNENFFNKNNGNSYCGLGKFSINCDAVG